MNRSRLPVSTSVRRPTSIAKGSTSFVGINRPSAIPSTLRKYANELFTPQTKTPRAPYGASTAGKSYQPTVATEKKYKRPLPEREECLQMFDALSDYLRIKAPNWPLPEAKKFFSSVSTTESTRIFQLLIGAIIPEFKITRLETDVPEALASLDYPYIRSVTKSSLVSVTSRSAATSLLVIFYWLIKHINLIENADLSYPGYAENVNQDEWNEVCMIKLSQPGAGEKVFQEACDRLYPFEDRQTLENEHEELTREAERLEKEYLDILDSIEEGQALDEDIIKCKEYKMKMEEYSVSKDKDKEEISRERERVRLQKEEIMNRIKRVESDIRKRLQELGEDTKDTEKLEQLEPKLMAWNLKCERETILRLNEAIKRMEQETKKEIIQLTDEETKVEVQKKETHRQLIDIQNMYEKELKQLDRYMVEESKQLETDSKEYAELGELQKQICKKVIESHEQEAKNLVNQIEREANRWEEARNISELNNKITKSAYRLLKKGLNLDAKQVDIPRSDIWLH